MRRIGLAVSLALSLLLSPRAVEARRSRAANKSSSDHQFVSSLLSGRQPTPVVALLNATRHSTPQLSTTFRLLRAWAAELDRLKAKVEKQLAESKTEYYEHIEELSDE